MVENGLNVWKGESTRDIIFVLSLIMVLVHYEEEMLPYNKQVKEANKEEMSDEEQKKKNYCTDYRREQTEINKDKYIKMSKQKSEKYLLY